ncbi:uncharacterized protein cubi_03424 [Cryptosporidium ubiquitum]|uniref:Uncharacterized protein n=1 Tax=Cryptosporidium ubiquitum TaxID=857276 RepID=A0A1J4MH83_9CRYT|nr:uncharacterized protein cubi_03424 [Cryptosporidium ubiquitum]OII73626.1 hypothetical protein cubi_03424 [Cryptosporidium ubiquitum]
MKGSEIGFIEDEKNEIVIIIDSQDQEDFAVVEEIVNEENILIEGLLWDDKSILNQIDQINQITSKNFESIKEEEISVEKMDEEFEYEELKYEIINNLEGIELENEIVNEEYLKAIRENENENKNENKNEHENEHEHEKEKEKENEKEQCFDIANTKDLTICLPEFLKMTEPKVDVGAENHLIDYVLNKNLLKVLFLKYQASNQTQGLRAINYLNKVQNIVKDHFQKSRKYNSMVILDLQKKSLKSNSKIKSIMMNQMDYLLKYEKNSKKYLQLESLTIQKEVEENNSLTKDVISVLRPSTFNQTFKKNHLNCNTEKSLLYIEIKDIEQLEADYSTENQIFEVIEETDGEFCNSLESVNPKLEGENFELNANLESGSHEHLEVEENRMIKVLESESGFELDLNIELELEPKSESEIRTKSGLESVLKLEELNDEFEVGSSNSILNVECKENPEFLICKGFEKTKDELESLGCRITTIEISEPKLENQSMEEEIKLKEMYSNQSLVDSNSIWGQNGSVEKKKDTPKSIEEGNDDILVELIVSQDENLSENKKDDQTENLTKFESIENFEISRKNSQMLPNLVGIMGFEESNDYSEIEKKQSHIEAENIKTERIATTNQENINADNFQTDQNMQFKMDISETKQDDREKLSKSNHEKDIFKLIQGFQSSKESDCSPFREKSETHHNKKPNRSSPYYCSHGKNNKSFGVFDQLISLAKNRNIARTVSKDLSRESIRAIEIIKKSRKPK